ncbi:hypothetical protein [Burkholderia ubonensis]|uniref:hypothetical protein n=1 Tax=Burkholderia ubonensis TaxID=101571 RepID=UPI0012FB7CDF|nr:hypothetical protein [Burkholderia ubonensis]
MLTSRVDDNQMARRFPIWRAGIGRLRVVCMCLPSQASRRAMPAIPACRTAGELSGSRLPWRACRAIPIRRSTFRRPTLRLTYPWCDHTQILSCTEVFNRKVFWGGRKKAEHDAVFLMCAIKAIEILITKDAS